MKMWHRDKLLPIPRLIPVALPRAGFSMVELVLVLAILATLTSLLVPAVVKVRASAERASCQQQLKQLALALHAYHQNFKAFPPAHCISPAYFPQFLRTSPPDDYWFFSWLVRITPFLEQHSIYRQIDFHAWPWWQYQQNRPIDPETTLNGIPLPQLLCPADARSELTTLYTDDSQPIGPAWKGAARVAFTEYLGVNGTSQFARDGILYVNAAVHVGHITDGTSTTMLIGERPPSSNRLFGWWFAGAGPMPYFGTADVVLGIQETLTSDSPPERFRPGRLDDWQLDHIGHFWSLHHGGANFAMADGSVRFLEYNTQPDVLTALATRQGGESPAAP